MPGPDRSERVQRELTRIDARLEGAPSLTSAISAVRHTHLVRRDDCLTRVLVDADANL